MEITTANLSGTVGDTGKASARINGKLVTWDVKVATANTKLEDGSANAFKNALKAAGFNDDDFTVDYDDNKITIAVKAGVEGKNRISAFKLTGAAVTGTTTITPDTADGKNGLGKAARRTGAMGISCSIFAAATF